MSSSLISGGLKDRAALLPSASVSSSRTARPKVTPRISYVVGRLDRALRREIGRLVAPHGLTVPQYTALSIVRDRAGLSNAQLARRSYVTPQSMNEVIAALERDGLVARSPAANHGRVLEMTLTEAGEEVLARCEQAVTRWRAGCSRTSTRRAGRSC